MQRRVFERFFTTGAQGSAMGLPMVVSTAMAHGGGLWLESEVGRGSTFRLCLPVALELEQLAPIPERPAHPSHKRILLIDDSDDVRRVTRLTLEEAGFAVFESGDGEVGVDLLRQHGADAALANPSTPSS